MMHGYSIHDMANWAKDVATQSASQNEAMNKQANEYFLSCPPEEQIRLLMLYMLDSIVQETIMKDDNFTIENISDKKEKVIISQKRLVEVIPPYDKDATPEQIKQAFENLVAQEDVIYANKNNRTFFLNLAKPGMVQAIKESVSYNAIMHARKSKIQSIKSGEQLLRLIREKPIKYIINFLRNKGINSTTEKGYTALHLAVIFNKVPLVKELLTMNVDVNLASSDTGNFPLLHAAKSNSLPICKMLVNARAKLNSRNLQGYTAFNAAAEDGHVDVVRYLAGVGADINMATENNDTPVNNASHNGHFKTVKLLVEELHADLGIKSKNGSTALTDAIARQHFLIADFLLSKGCDINNQNEEGVTALMTGVLNGSKESATYCLQHGANIHLQDAAGENAFHFAAKTGRIKFLKTLLAADIRNKEGRSAYEMARESKHQECKSFLASLTGKIIKTVCTNCKKEGENYLSCSKCGMVRYCGRDCQKLHWKIHKLECKTKEQLEEQTRASLNQKYKIYDSPDPSWKQGPPMLVGDDEYSPLWNNCRRNMPIVIGSEIEYSTMYLTCQDKECANPEHARFVQSK